MQLKKVDMLNKPYKIYADYVESGAIDQFVEAMEQPYVVQGALMPDVHQGYSLPIGAVVACEGVVVPAYVGFDIGCGMCAVPTNFSLEGVRSHSKEIFDLVYKMVPVGTNRNAKNAVTELEKVPHTDVVANLIKEGGLNEVGSLGSGNHFIEIGHDETDRVWIVIHSGSRHVGHSVASHYMKIASGTDKAKEGHYGLSTASHAGDDYIMDLKFCLEFALANRLEMIKRVGTAIGEFTEGEIHQEWLINRNHNHAEEKDGRWIHRKGATHAESGMMGVIPGCMRDGSFIVIGKGNPDSLYSSSHGAGRIMGRGAAKRTLDMEVFKAEMAAKGICAKVEESTLDESAGAYKRIFEVMALQSDLVEVVHHIKPVINIKS